MKKETRLSVRAVANANVLPVGATNQGQVQFIGKVFNQPLGLDRGDLYGFAIPGPTKNKKINEEIKGLEIEIQDLFHR